MKPPVVTKNGLTVKNLAHVVSGIIINPGSYSNVSVNTAFTSDLMSDVLTIDACETVLITGLTNPQVVRTAEMSDILCIIIGRNKKCSREIRELATQCQVTLIESPFSLYKISGLLYESGIKPIF